MFKALLASLSTCLAPSLAVTVVKPSLASHSRDMTRGLPEKNFPAKKFKILCQKRQKDIYYQPSTSCPFVRPRSHAQSLARRNCFRIPRISDTQCLNSVSESTFVHPLSINGNNYIEIVWLPQRAWLDRSLSKWEELPPSLEVGKLAAAPRAWIEKLKIHHLGWVKKKDPQRIYYGKIKLQANIRDWINHLGWVKIQENPKVYT